MGSIKTIRNDEIKIALEGITRQYFVGNLKRPQRMPFFKSESLEIGITAYDTFVSEPTHVHEVATEYQYMISGRTQYLDVETGKVHEFVAGDFYMIEPHTVYAQKSKPGTKILFIKVPSINDKRVVSVEEDVQKWLDEKLYTVRTDYYYDKSAPAPNSVKPAAAVAILNGNNILMLKRRDNGKWTMPGGTLEYGESLAECAVREVREEAGLDVEITDVIGTYTDPNIRVAYSDGEVRQEFTIVYTGKCTGSTVELDEESTAYQWVSLTEVDNLKMADSQKRRVQDVIQYHKTGKKKMV